jgi:hypothetical protein
MKLLAGIAALLLVSGCATYPASTVQIGGGSGIGAYPPGAYVMADPWYSPLYRPYYSPYFYPHYFSVWYSPWFYYPYHRQPWYRPLSYYAWLNHTRRWYAYGYPYHFHGPHCPPHPYGAGHDDGRNDDGRYADAGSGQLVIPGRINPGDLEDRYRTDAGLSTGSGPAPASVVAPISYPVFSSRQGREPLPASGGSQLQVSGMRPAASVRPTSARSQGTSRSLKADGIQSRSAVPRTGASHQQRRDSRD